jgi:hypothetical protein
LLTIGFAAWGKVFFPAEYRSPSEGRRGHSFPRDKGIERGAICCSFQLSRLIVQMLKRAEFFLTAEPGFLNSRLQDLGGFITNLDRNGIRMSVLAAMRQEKPKGWERTPVWALAMVHGLAEQSGGRLVLTNRRDHGGDRAAC